MESPILHRLIVSILVLEERIDGLAPFLGLLEQEQVSAVDDPQLRTGDAAGEDLGVALRRQWVARCGQHERRDVQPVQPSLATSR